MMAGDLVGIGGEIKRRSEMMSSAVAAGREAGTSAKGTQQLTLRQAKLWVSQRARMVRALSANKVPRASC